MHEQQHEHSGVIVDRGTPTPKICQRSDFDTPLAKMLLSPDYSKFVYAPMLGPILESLCRVGVMRRARHQLRQVFALFLQPVVYSAGLFEFGPQFIDPF